MGSRGVLRDPNKFIKHLLFPHNSQQQTKRCYRTPPISDVEGGGCQDMLRWSGQNANQKVDPDKMPTTEKKSRTKCQPRFAFCPVGILSYHLAYWVDVYMVPVFLVYDQYFLYFLKRQVSFPGTGQKI